MALLHRAYSFDAPALLHRARALWAEGAEALRGAAVAVVAEASEATRSALADVRFSEEWLELDDADGSWVGERFVVLLAGSVQTLPSLSRSFAPGHLVLRDILEPAGWPRERVALLLSGRDLAAVVPDDDPMRRDVAGIGQYGGFLTPADVASLRHMLETHSPVRATLPPEAADAVAFLAQSNRTSPERLVEGAVADAKEMLETAERREASVLMVLD